jgi:tyrosinase
VHNLIGGIMATMQSPTDPIFYLHHANIDRLRYGWVRSGGKKVPSQTSSYWAGSFTYASGLTMAKSSTYSPTLLNYDNANDTQPTSLPPSAKAKTRSPFQLTQAQMAPFLTRLAAGNFAATAARTISATSRSLGGVSSVGPRRRLGERTASSWDVQSAGDTKCRIRGNQPACAIGG